MIKSLVLYSVCILSSINFIGFSGLASAAQTVGAEAEKVSLNGPNWHYFSKLEQAGFLLLDENNHQLESKNAQQFYVPASTTKLLTALLSLQHWGEDYRFKTEFYLDYSNSQAPIIIVKGFGDPFLVSEDLLSIAKNLQVKLQEKGIKRLSGIQLDASYYHAGLVMPGTGLSDNPYDAIPSAIAANFNSIYVQKRGQKFLSAEPQTPMTESGFVVARSIKNYKSKKTGKFKRVNLGKNSTLNQRYFAELLGEFLKEQGIGVDNTIRFQTVQGSAGKNVRPLYTHLNSRTLAEVIRPMMKYSTNFIANQLALNLSADLFGAPANQDKLKRAFQKLLTENFGWQKFNIEDGAGLSRHNRLAPSQLVDVLQAFKPWIKLLPEVESRVFAKSGTLIGVSTLAGYIKQDQQVLPFAMMINQKVPYRFRNKLAKELTLFY